MSVDKRAEIERVKGETNSALDRIITTAGHANDIGANTQAQLLEQGDRIKSINREVDKTDAVLNSTHKKLKHGFGLRGWLTSHKARVPVLDDTPAYIPSRKPRAVDRKEGDAAPASGADLTDADFDTKLDAIDKLIDNMAVTANGLHSELKAQAEDLDKVGNDVHKVDEKAKKQSRDMARRFKLK
eukprot:TRINITY_DN14863_c0_g1_i1.p1 TRINITY_DN14863_c0_g1~~TRINITY_DN14863_c0_g1_i1.p1  ORF type:complete len:210 (-),score=39.23 TRINITY_DN14863_c0_g1_i1:191-745(-)